MATELRMNDAANVLNRRALLQHYVRLSYYVCQHLSLTDIGLRELFCLACYGFRTLSR
jgi:hypothetical protein